MKKTVITIVMNGNANEIKSELRPHVNFIDDMVRVNAIGNDENVAPAKLIWKFSVKPFHHKIVMEKLLTMINENVVEIIL